MFACVALRKEGLGLCLLRIRMHFALFSPLHRVAGCIFEHQPFKPINRSNFEWLIGLSGVARLSGLTGVARSWFRF